MIKYIKMVPKEVNYNLVSKEILKFLKMYKFPQGIEEELITQEDVIFWLKINFNIWTYCRPGATDNTWESVIVKLSPNKLEKITSEEDSPEKSINSAFFMLHKVLIGVLCSKESIFV